MNFIVISGRISQVKDKNSTELSDDRICFIIIVDPVAVLFMNYLCHREWLVAVNLAFPQRSFDIYVT